MGAGVYKHCLLMSHTGWCCSDSDDLAETENRLIDMCKLNLWNIKNTDGHVRYLYKTWKRLTVMCKI